MATELSPFSQRIWDMKYRLRRADGEALENSIAETWHRVAGALAAVEADPGLWEGRFYDALKDFSFLPAGRILAGAGSGHQVTLFNCFVMGRIEDDMSGIFDALKEAALTLQQGGGIGYDFSTLRPRGAPVQTTGADASGPISFMDVWDAMCRTIMSAGHRRGAMMATLACDHPDIEAFIEAKQDPRRLRMFNLSVLVTDAFMEAARSGDTWALKFAGKTYRKVSARALWNKMLRATYDYAEPGVIFIDRINKENNLAYCETISATNPCGEQPLPPYGACLLGSINLAKLVRDPFTKKARLDNEALERLVPTAVRMLDNAIETSNFPLAAQAAEARAKRRIGLGITGLADALILCNLRYGSGAAVAATEDWLSRLSHTAYRTSVELAREKGAFPLFDRDAYLAAANIRRLPPEVQAEIGKHGIRNALVTSIAPTGTISLLADNVSSGLEPVFRFSYGRKVLQPDGTSHSEEVSDPAYRLFREMHGEEIDLPPAFVDVATLEPAAHLVMQAACQRHIDAAVSKTLNVPRDISFEAFRDIYSQAYDLGCKGCTTYRPNEITGSVLEEHSASPAPQMQSERDENASIVYMAKPLERPEVLPGRTYKLRWPESDHAIYITINDVVRDGRRRPFEIFMNSKNMEHYAWALALTRMISAVFRRGGDVSFVVEELKAVFDPRGGAWIDGKYLPSLLAAIGQIVEEHMIAIGFLTESSSPRRPLALAAGGDDATKAGVTAEELTAVRPRQCPKCGSAALIRQEGCDLCTACAYSRCV